MDIQIRNESKNDIEHIHRVITLAFQHAPHTCHIEQFIVKALRRADALVLSQLAEKKWSSYRSYRHFAGKHF